MRTKMKMKFLAAGAAFCALGMTGCSNDGVEDAAPQVGKQVMMTLRSATDTPQTRADYEEDATDDTKMNFSWRSGDAMSIVVDGVVGNENKELTTTEAGKSVPFSGEVTAFDGTKTIYAFYPYSATPYAVTGGDNKETATAALTLPATQLYTIGGAISNSFMVGVGSATATNTDIDASASLKQVMSIIKLNIMGAPGKVTGVKLTCAEALFPTTATVKLSDATISSPGNLVKELAMTVTDGTEGTDKTVSFAMFPTTGLDGKEIAIKVTYEGGKSKTIKKSGINFERNMHYVMEFDGTPGIDAVEIGNLSWAAGDLVSDGKGGVTAGAPNDVGLFFQFGSLVGWSTEKLPLTIAAKPNGFNGNTSWANTGKIWQGTTGTVPFTVAGSANEKAGVGDPCRYYLKGTWRLPTGSEFVKLFENNGYPTNGPWIWDSTSNSVVHKTSDLKFLFFGYSYDGQEILAQSGYWSGTPSATTDKGYNFAFNKTAMGANLENFRVSGRPIRCVQNK